MSKRVERYATLNNFRKYANETIRHVEEERARPLTEADVERIIVDLQSPDEHVRARALRSVCPCHMRWDAFDRLRKTAQKLRRDPSPGVRAIALHLEEDARLLSGFEAAVRRFEDEAEERSFLYRFGKRYKTRRTRPSH